MGKAEDTQAPLMESRPWRRATGWLATLGAFFYLSYGVSNWLASQRGNVSAIVFQWEHGIPFLAWTIIPYLSTHVLFALSFYVCRNRAELDNHAKRLLTAQAIAVACFIVFPLRISFAKPQMTGEFGLLFTLDVAGNDRVVAARRGIRSDDLSASLRRRSDRLSAGPALPLDVAA